MSQTNVWADSHVCCCGHGVRCSCAVKKEHLDTVHEDFSHITHPTLHPKEPHKPRVSSMNSHETKTTIFTNGHHKPVHKINDAHNHCGAPYRIPHKTHPLHVNREMAQRSSDSLPLTKSGAANHETPPLHETATSAPQPVRKVKSEHGTPELKPIPDNSPEHQGLVIPAFDAGAFTDSPLDNGSSPFPQNSTPDSQFPDRFPDSLFMSYEQAHEYQPPFPSGGLPEIDWSTYNFQNANSQYNVNNGPFISSQPPSYTSHEQMSHLSHPGLASSSGEISDAEDFVHLNRPGNPRNNSQDASMDFSSTGGDEMSEAYRLSSASSYLGLPQTQILANGNLESLDIDEYLKQAEIEAKQMRMQQQVQQQFQPQSFPLPPASHEASQAPNYSQTNYTSGEHPFTVQEAQNMAHMGGGDDNEKATVPPTTWGDDPMWSCPQTPGGTNLNFEDDDDEWPQEPQ